MFGHCPVGAFVGAGPEGYTYVVVEFGKDARDISHTAKQEEHAGRTLRDCRNSMKLEGEDSCKNERKHDGSDSGAGEC